MLLTSVGVVIRDFASGSNSVMLNRSKCFGYVPFPIVSLSLFCQFSGALRDLLSHSASKSHHNV